MNTLETSALIYDRLGITPAQLTAFCQRWQVQELALFGSILREDFQPDRSDVDLLVSFQPLTRISLMGLVRMQAQLEALLQRSVDLVDYRDIAASHNQARQQEILTTARILYVSR